MSTADVVGVQLDALAQSLGLPKPEREVQVCEGRRFRWDFAWARTTNHLPIFVAVEYQGATWIKGGHSTGAGIDRDAEKLILGQLAGWLVVPVTASMVRSGRAIELTEQVLRQRMGVLA